MAYKNDLDFLLELGADFSVLPKQIEYQAFITTFVNMAIGTYLQQVFNEATFKSLEPASFEKFVKKHLDKLAIMYKKYENLDVKSQFEFTEKDDTLKIVAEIQFGTDERTPDSDFLESRATLENEVADMPILREIRQDEFVCPDLDRYLEFIKFLFENGQRSVTSKTYRIRAEISFKLDEELNMYMNTVDLDEVSQ